MSGSHRSIKILKRATDTRKKVPKDAFEQILANLKAEVESGLTEEEIETLVSYITLLDLPATQFCALLRCIVPNTFVSRKATKDILTWIISHFRFGARTSVMTALQWITGLVEFKLADCEVIDGYYEIFFVLLKLSSLEPHVCKLIYLLTKPDDVSRSRVQEVLKHNLMTRRSKYTVTLLCLYKSLKPECVPENIPAINQHSVFRSVPWLMHNFQLAQQRNHLALERTGRHFMGNDIKSFERPEKRAKLDLIPPVNYIHVGSSLYEEKKKRLSVLAFKDVVSAGCNLLSLDPPCNVVSLLGNKVGIHIIAFGDEELQMRLSVTLYHQLEAAFLNRNISCGQKERILKQVVALEEYMQQGIPVVSVFLAQYLLLWDGEDFQQYIFKLLEWITFQSFEDLKCDILDNVHSLFVTSNIDTKCLIIATLRRLLINLFRAITFNVGTDLPPTAWDATTTLPQIIKFVDDLCVLGLFIEDGNIALLDEAFTFYETISHLEASSPLSMFTLIPSGVLYRGLFTRVACFIERVCALLIRYKTIHNNTLREMKSRGIFSDMFEMANSYAFDVINCLWSCKSISSRNDGYIFQDIPQVVIRHLKKQVDLDPCFSIWNHIAFYQYALDADSEEGLIYDLQEHFPNIVKIFNG